MFKYFLFLRIYFLLAACDGVSKFPHFGNGKISSKVDQFEYQKKVKVYNVCLRGHLVKWGCLIKPFLCKHSPPSHPAFTKILFSKLTWHQNVTTLHAWSLRISEKFAKNKCFWVVTDYLQKYLFVSCFRLFAKIFAKKKKPRLVKFQWKSWPPVRVVNPIYGVQCSAKRGETRFYFSQRIFARHQRNIKY